MADHNHRNPQADATSPVDPVASHVRTSIIHRPASDPSVRAPALLIIADLPNAECEGGHIAKVPTPTWLEWLSAL